MAASSLSKRQEVDPPSTALPPGLYVLSTPIGAADDITLRGLDALRRADVLSCEDSRVLRRLLDLHGVPLNDRPIIPYHDHNAAAARPRILKRLQEGASVVYASDAGTPLVADPGYRLVAAAREIGAPVTALPGASALLAALTLSGLPTDRFSFGGFPPPKSTARRRAFEEWRGAPGSLAFFEAPHRVAACLEDMSAVFGPDRPAAIARELTKRFEEVRQGSLAELVQSVADRPPKGEIVVVIGPAPPPGPPDEADIDALLLERLATDSVKDAARAVAEALSAPRKTVYARALELSAQHRAAEEGREHGAETDEPDASKS
ncbi:MAG: 16S rRNA (cytidine(1402)-2'-O)-methyltransferase [Rhodobacteraceae bacterium]|nr:16S rRNA (cytidine(1402)-2'-O)-methyltransferase [Paracoccaceae bacterium]